MGSKDISSILNKRFGVNK